MAEIDKDAPIPSVLLEYVKNPVPEYYTEEIFEDLHAVIDEHLTEIGRQRGSEDSDEELIRSWEETYHDKIEERRQNIKESHGALLPFAFVSANVKMEFLIKADHPEYGENKVPDGVIEVMQEFVEIITYRDELGE